jgi:hypothetical protein
VRKKNDYREKLTNEETQAHNGHQKHPRQRNNSEGHPEHKDNEKMSYNASSKIAHTTKPNAKNSPHTLRSMLKPATTTVTITNTKNLQNLRKMKQKRDKGY